MIDFNLSQIPISSRASIALFICSLFIPGHLIIYCIAPSLFNSVDYFRLIVMSTGIMFPLLIYWITVFVLFFSLITPQGNLRLLTSKQLPHVVFFSCIVANYSVYRTLWKHVSGDEFSIVQALISVYDISFYFTLVLLFWVVVFAGPEFVKDFKREVKKKMDSKNEPLPEKPETSNPVN